MKHSAKRTTALALALLMLLSAFASCSESEVNTPETTAGEQTPTVSADPEAALTEEETVEDDGKAAYAPELPERKYEGYAFRIVSRDDDMHTYPVHTRDLYAEEMNGDAINDAVFERNSMIQETYDIVIKLETYSETTSETTSNTLVENSVMAGSDDYDLLTTHMIYGANSVLKNVFLNYNNMEYVDLTKPYWNQSAHPAFSVGDKTYLALSDLCFSSNDNTHCMVYNKELAKNYNVGDIYEIVKSNEWTYDKFRTMCENVSNDTNGDGQMTEEDVYGYFIGGTSGLINWMFAANLHVMAKDENNLPYLDFFSEKTVDVYTWMYDLYQSNDSYCISSWVDPQVPVVFSGDHALFMTTQIGVIEDLRDMESDFGVLPYPKWTAEQETYYHYVDGHAAIMAVPKTVNDIERTGILLEALAYESYKSVLPLYFDVMMTKKNVRDEQSGEMLELIYNTRAFDFAYVYDNFTLSFAFSNQATANNPDLASYYAKQEKAITKIMDRNIIGKITEFQD
ncbi:MAG: hypothetical protein J6I42_05840 [Clostridia bacterium]|nr:hypothetical protein [Clostridia bacterium]MBO5257480.1 hypothetical protein [Clostridia bacterium]